MLQLNINKLVILKIQKLLLYKLELIDRQYNIRFINLRSFKLKRSRKRKA